MKKAFFYFLIFICGAFKPALSQAPVYSDTITGGNTLGFNKTVDIARPVEELVLSGELNVVLVEGSVQRVRIEGDEAGVNSIRLKTGKGKLKISTAFLAFTRKKTLVTLSLPNLKLLKITGDALVKSKGVLHISDLELILDSDGKVSLKVAGSTVKTRLRGRGSIRIIGAFRQITSHSTVDGWQINLYEAETARNAGKNTAESMND